MNIINRVLVSLAYRATLILLKLSPDAVVLANVYIKGGSLFVPAGGMRIIVGCVFEDDAQVVHSPANVGFAEHDNHAKIGEWGELVDWGNQDCDKFEI